MNREPVFSVLVTTCDRPELLRIALDSVCKQTYSDFECIVFNDGESAVEIPDDKRFVLIDKRERAGFTAAINTAIGEARGRYLTFLDDDDAYTPHRLEIGLRGMEGVPLSCCWRANYATGVAGKNRILNGWVHDEIVDRSPPLLGQATVERKRMFPLDDRLRHASDVEWWLRATKVMPVATVPEVGLMFRRHPGRMSVDYEFRFAQRSILYSIHPEYFKTHRRANARFQKRTGYAAYHAGRVEEARAHLFKAALLTPRPRNLYWLARSLVPRRFLTPPN